MDMLTREELENLYAQHPDYKSAMDWTHKFGDSFDSDTVLISVVSFIIEALRTKILLSLWMQQDCLPNETLRFNDKSYGYTLDQAHVALKFFEQQQIADSKDNKDKTRVYFDLLIQYEALLYKNISADTAMQIRHISVFTK